MPIPTSAPVRPPTAPPTPAPASAAIIGPAAMNGPRPGIASAPIPASHPKPPPNNVSSSPHPLASYDWQAATVQEKYPGVSNVNAVCAPLLKRTIAQTKTKASWPNHSASPCTSCPWGSHPKPGRSSPDAGRGPKSVEDAFQTPVATRQTRQPCHLGQGFN
jgi:hypothetical protein